MNLNFILRGLGSRLSLDSSHVARYHVRRTLRRSNVLVLSSIIVVLHLLQLLLLFLRVGIDVL
jgi:hypothetical protein